MCLLLLDTFYCQLIDVCFLPFDELVDTLVKGFYPQGLAVYTMLKF